MDLAQSTKVVPGQMVTPDFSKLNLNAPQEFVKNQLAIQQSGQSIAANQGVSEAMQQSINPDTGEIDQNKLLSLLGKDPRTSYNLPEIANKVNLNAQSQELAKQARIETSVKQINYMNDRLSNLIFKKDLNFNHVRDLLVKAVDDKVITVSQAQRELSDLPKDEKDLLPWVKEHFKNTSSAKSLIDLYIPTEPYKDPNTGKEIKVPKSVIIGLEKNENPNIDINAPVTGLATSTQSALTTTGTNQANAAQEQASLASNAPTITNILESARQNLENPNLTTGPGVEGRNQVASFFAALSPQLTEKIFGKEFTGTIKDQEEFKKYVTQYANFASANLGSGTDARLNVALTGNPNPNIQKVSNQELITKTIAIVKMQQAQNYAWNKSGISPDKFNAWQADFNKKVKPEVFAFDAMTPKQQKDFVERKTKDGSLGAFRKDLTNMVQQGFIDMPGR
jgi:hypothetical protein